jgi:hypothetical protein
MAKKRSIGVAPVPYQYRPIGAERLAPMTHYLQEKFDTAKAAIEDSDFTIDHLNWSEEEKAKAKELEQTLEGKQEELLQNLYRKKDSGYAVSTIKKLNKLYNEDKEISAIRGNYQGYTSLMEDLQERAKKDPEHYPQDYLEKYRFLIKETFNEAGGTNYNPETGTYNSVMTDPPPAHLEKEMMDLSWKLATGGAEHVTQILGSDWAEGDEGLVEKVKQKIEAKGGDYVNHEDLAAEIKTVLAESNRYQEFLEFEGKLFFAEDSRYNDLGTNKRERINNFSEKKVNEYIERRNERLNNLKEVLGKGGLSDEQRAKYEANIKDEENYINKLNSQKQEHLNLGTIDDLGEAFYKAMHVEDRLTNLGVAYEDIVDHQDIINDSIVRSQGEGSGRIPSDNYKNVQIATHPAAAPVVEDVTLLETTTGDAAMDAKIASNYFNAEYAEFSKFIRNTSSATNGYAARIFNKTGNDWEGFKEENPTLVGATNTVSNTLDRLDKYSASINDITKDILELQDEYKGEVNKPEEYFSQLAKLIEDRSRLIESGEYADFSILEDRLLEEAKTNEDLQKLFLENDNDYRKVINILDDKAKAAYDKANYEIEDHPSVKEAQEAYDKAVAASPIQPDQDANVIFAKQRLDFAKASVISLQSNLANTAIVNDLKAIPGLNVFGEWRDELVYKERITPNEIVINETSNNYTNGAVNNVVDYVKDNMTAGSAARPMRVEYNPFDGEIKNEINADYDLRNYKEQTPSLVATTTGPGGENIVVLRYKRNWDDSDKTKIAKYIDSRTAPNDLDETIKERIDALRSNPTALANFIENNPSDLYVAVRGFSDHIPTRAAETFSKNMTSYVNQLGSTENDFKRNELLYSIGADISAMAAFSNLDMEEKKDYAEMASSLKNWMAAEDEQGVDIVRTPAAYKYLDDNGKRMGYEIDYDYVYDDIQKRNKLVRRIYTINFDSYEDENPDRAHYKTEEVTDISAGALRAVDITYGTGNPSDVITSPQNNYQPFVPMFLDPTVSEAVGKIPPQ